jgi:hypothetical protein
MDGKNFIEYANLSFEKSYESLNCIDGKWKDSKDRIMPLYKQLKFNSKIFNRVEYINAFVHPDDKDAEFVDDLKYEYWEF